MGESVMLPLPTISNLLEESLGMDRETKKRRITIGLVFLSAGLFALGIGLHSIYAKLSEVGRIAVWINSSATSEDERRARRLTDDELKNYENILRELKTREVKIICDPTTDIPLGEWHRMAKDLLQTDSKQVFFLYGKHLYGAKIKEDSGKTLLDLGWEDIAQALPGICLVLIGLFILRSTTGRGSSATWHCLGRRL